MAVYSRLALIATTALFTGCGDSDAPPGDDPEAGGRVDALGLVRDAGSGPSLDQIRARIAENVSTTCRFQRENPEAAGESSRVVAIRETSRNAEEGAGGVSGVVIEYDADIEFTAPCYYQDIEHDAGDKLSVYGEAEFVNDGNAWVLLPISIWKR